MKLSTKLKLAVFLAVAPVAIAFAANNILLYKHNTITESDWKLGAEANKALLGERDANGDYTDSTWTPTASSEAVEEALNNAPTAPVFTAEVFDEANVSQGTL